MIECLVCSILFQYYFTLAEAATENTSTLRLVDGSSQAQKMTLTKETLETSVIIEHELCMLYKYYVVDAVVQRLHPFPSSGEALG